MTIRASSGLNHISLRLFLWQSNRFGNRGQETLQTLIAVRLLMLPGVTGQGNLHWVEKCSWARPGAATSGSVKQNSVNYGFLPTKSERLFPPRAGKQLYRHSLGNRRGLGGERKPQGEAVSPVLYSGQQFRCGNETDNSRHAMEMKGSLLPGCAGETLAENLCPVWGIRF